MMKPGQLSITIEYKLDEATAKRLEQELGEVDLDQPQFEDYVFDDRYEVIGELPDDILRYWHLIRFKEDESEIIAEGFALERAKFLREIVNVGQRSLVDYLSTGYTMYNCIEELEHDCNVLRAHMLHLAKEHFGAERISDKPVVAVCGRTLVQDEEDSPLVATYQMPRIDTDILWAFGLRPSEDEPTGL